MNGLRVVIFLVFIKEIQAAKETFSYYVGTSKKCKFTFEIYLDGDSRPHTTSDITHNTDTATIKNSYWEGHEKFTRIKVIFQPYDGALVDSIHFQISISKEPTGERLLYFERMFTKKETVIDIKDCWPGTYGVECLKCSSHCDVTGLSSKSTKQICNRWTGVCLSSKCKKHYAGIYCNTCIPGRYGDKCEPCSINCKVTNLQPTYAKHICNSTTGVCFSRKCLKHFSGPKCNKCGKYYYGGGCQNKCGHCLNNKRCDRITGKCVQCAPGYLGNKCDIACEAGRFGINCKGKCNCFRGVSCHPATGSCGNHGCAMRYFGSECNIYRACLPGTYGNKCEPCSTNCKVTGLTPKDSRQICNLTTGVCLSGKCLKTFSGPKCDKCEIGRYGLNCQNKCGHCLNKDDCHFITGECTQCKAGYLGNKCDIEKLVQLTLSPNDKQLNSSVTGSQGPILTSTGKPVASSGVYTAAIMVGVLVIILSIVIVFYYFLRTKKKDRHTDYDASEQYYEKDDSDRYTEFDITEASDIDVAGRNNRLSKVRASDRKQKGIKPRALHRNRMFEDSERNNRHTNYDASEQYYERDDSDRYAEFDITEASNIGVSDRNNRLSEVRSSDRKQKDIKSQALDRNRMFEDSERNKKNRKIVNTDKSSHHDISHKSGQFDDSIRRDKKRKSHVSERNRKNRKVDDSDKSSHYDISYRSGQFDDSIRSSQFDDSRKEKRRKSQLSERKHKKRNVDDRERNSQHDDISYRSGQFDDSKRSRDSDVPLKRRH